MRNILGLMLLIFSAVINYCAITSMISNEIIIEWELVRIGSSKIILILIIDFISLRFLSLVRLVAGSVLLYRTSYIRSEHNFSRFIGLVFSFVISIFILILRPNIISLLLGWDGLGVTSYLLVIFYQSRKSYNAGIITALTNRLGDVGLLISLSLIFFLGDWTYLFLNSSDINLSSVLIFLIIISACTKRAQIPFSAWLPAAIAAPTPVSALVHSSTLVTAGVYLLIRINLLIFEYSATEFLICLGTFTMLIAGLRAILEIDIKKIIALSTLSQLGVMMIILGAGIPILAYFHLLSHAFFKAILFMCAGIVIHNIRDYQDIRKIGGGNILLPVPSAVMITANLRLCGMPFIRGFYSKDLILEIMIIKGLNIFIFCLIAIATFLTVAYSCRLRFLVGLNCVKSENIFFTIDGDKIILLGILILLPFSIQGGIYLKLNLLFSQGLVFLPIWLKITITCIIFSAAMSLIRIYKIAFVSKNRILTWFLRLMWFMPVTFRINVTRINLALSKRFFKIVELRWVEYAIFKFNSIVLEKIFSVKHFTKIRYSYILNRVEIAAILFLTLILFF